MDNIKNIQNTHRTSGKRAHFSEFSKQIRATVTIALAFLCLAGCGGAKVLKEPKAMELEGSLVVESDSSLTAGFDWVIVRDGPGTWSKNADWDEYLFRVHNASDSDISIESVDIYDSLDTRISSSASRRELIKGSKAASKRYKEEGLRVKAGLGGTGLVAVGGATYVAGMSAGAALFAGGATGAAAGVAVVGALVAAPVLIVGGVFRGVNNHKVTSEITNRHTQLPLALSAGNDAALDLFFPLSPSPGKIEINYSDANGAHQLTIDTSVALSGLHLRAAEQAQASD